MVAGSELEGEPGGEEEDVQSPRATPEESQGSVD